MAQKFHKIIQKGAENRGIRRALVWGTMRYLVVLLGNQDIDVSAVEQTARRFGWKILRVTSLSALEQVDPEKVVAVIFEPAALEMDWALALEQIRLRAPAAPVIVCHSFAERLPWPEMARAGAFHSLHLPFHPDEVRQSLGFVASTRRCDAPVEVAC